MASVGSMMPDEPRFHGPAFNRAAAMFQEGLLTGLADAGIAVDAVFTLEPMAAIPGGPRLLGRPGTLTTRMGWTIRLLPYLNFYPLKWLTAGMSAFVALLLWSWRNRKRTRVIHCVNLTMPPGIFIWLAARLTGARTIASILDVFKPGALVPDTWYRRLDFAMQRRLLPHYDGMMVVADAIAEDLVPGRRVCRIEGGLLPIHFAKRPPTQPRRAGDAFRVVLSGSLEVYNGVELALRAAASLPEGYQLLVAGVGSRTEHVREYSRRDPRIQYLGFLDFADVLQLYWSADLLLNVRLTRTVDTRYFFPSKLMELLASGTPVLSTCTGHVEREYGHVTYLLREETPEILASEIMRIARLPVDQREALGARAREFMLENKTWQRQGEKLLRYIEAEVLVGR